MSDSFRTICRLALVAVGLTFGSPATYAATATIDCGAGTPTWNAGTNTLSCQTGTKCTISGPTSAVVNTLFTLSASCPSGTTYTWKKSGVAMGSCTADTCDITETTTGSKSYTVETETPASVSNSYAVNVTSGAVVPSGCTLSANPTTGPSGSTVTLTANCTAGTAPITVAWGGAAGTSGCPTSINGAAITCPVSNVTTNSTWTASFSNSAGNFANNPRSAGFTVQSGGGAFAGCPAGTVTIDGQWGNTAIDTAQWGEFGGNIVSVRLVPPSTMSGTKSSSWSEFGSGPTVREAVLSTVPCDFTNANALKNGFNQFGHKFDVVSFSFDYRLGTPSGFTYGVTAGQSYYINIRNKNSAGVDTCTISDCRMRGGLPQ